MKHNHGVEVYIVDNKGMRLSEYHNPSQSSHDQYQGAFGSRRIAGEYGSPFELVILFKPEFKPYKSDGVLITIAISGNLQPITGAGDVQSYWVDAARMHSHHRFTNFTLWSSSDECATTKQQCLRFPIVDTNYTTATADWMDNEYYTANFGCVSVCIERGKIAGNADTLADYEWAPTDPPAGYHYQSINATHRVVRSEWFLPLRSDNGLPYLFEYRTVVPKELHGLTQAEDEIVHGRKTELVDANLDVEIQVTDEQSDDRWGAAEYDDADTYTADNASTTSSGRASSAIHRRKRRVTATAPPGRAVRPRLIVVTANDEESLYSATPRSGVARTTQRSSSIQERTPPPDAALDPYSLQDPDDEEVKEKKPAIETINAQPTNAVDLSRNSPSPPIKGGPEKVQADEEVDIDDLRDQVRIIELRRQIRAAEKKQAARIV